MGFLLSLKNVSGATKAYGFGDIANNVTMQIPSAGVQSKLADNEALLADIDSGDIVVIDGSSELKPAMGKNALKHFSPMLTSSWAVDKNAIDQAVSSANGWTVVEHERVLWDINSDYNTSTEDFDVPIDAIYKSDFKVRVKNISNCDQIEIAVFQRGSPDDYWFIIDRAYPASQSLTEVVLSGSVSFDMYSGESYCLKILLTANSGTGTADIDGSDDYTAWGYDFLQKL